MGGSAQNSSGSQSSSGQQSFSSNPVNLQNSAYTNLAGPTADWLNRLYGYFGQPMPSPYQTQNGQSYAGSGNPLVAQTTGQQNNLVGQTGWLGNIANQNYYGMQSSVDNANQFANSNPLQGAMNQNQAAGNWYGQTQLNNAYGQYDKAGSTAFNGFNAPNNNFNDASSTAQSIPWQTNPWFNAQGGTTGNLSPAYGAAFNMLSPNYAAGLASSPQTQAAIQSAVNPLINTFNSQTVPGLQGTFSAAGQRVNTADSGGVGGSSAFDMAGANALSGLGANIGNVSGQIANNAYQTGLQQQSQAINQVGNLVGQQAGIYGQVGQNIGNALNQSLQGEIGAGQGQVNSATAQGNLYNQTGQNIANTSLGAEAGLNQSAQTGGQLASEQVQNLLSASAGSQGLLSSQLNDTINALNASALPQLTQQYGINQGLQLYQQQISQLLQSLGLGSQASQPAIGNNAMGFGTSSGSGKNSSKGGGLTL